MVAYAKPYHTEREHNNLARLHSGLTNQTYKLLEGSGYDRFLYLSCY